MQVAPRNLGIPVEVALVPSEDTEVVVDVVVCRAVIVVEAAAICRVVGNDEVATRNVRLRDRRRRARSDCGEVRQPIPRVEGAVVGRLATRVEEQVRLDERASAEPVVEVDRRAWDVKDDVLGERRLWQPKVINTKPRSSMTRKKIDFIMGKSLASAVSAWK